LLAVPFLIVAREELIFFTFIEVGTKVSDDGDYLFSYRWQKGNLNTAP
jgi:hypothetical protein